MVRIIVRVLMYKYNTNAPTTPITNAKDEA